MNNKIKEVIKGIIGINYRTDTDKIRVRKYTGGTEETLGQSSSLSEALHKLKGNHWIDISPTKGDFGFIYTVIDTKEKKGYLGRKQLLYYNKESQDYSIPSGWECYKGSCGPLATQLTERPEDFIFYRILNCKDRDEMGYSEHFLIRSIFANRLVTGELEYYNNVIPKLFRGQLDGVSDRFKGIVSSTSEGL